MRDLELRTQKCHDNVDEIARLMGTWDNSPLVQRKDGKATEQLPHRTIYRETALKRCASAVYTILFVDNVTYPLFAYY